MARLPTVAIIGRPNTGKSRLFNRLLGRRKAIVSEIPGTTRDQIASRVETDDLDYLLVDTGGIGGGTEDLDLEDDVAGQSLLALEQADLILFTINSREQLTSSDFEVVDLLRRKRKRHVPIILVLTKCDNPAITEEIMPQYWELGIADEIIPVSAPHNLGTDELCHAIVEQLQKLQFTKEAPNDPQSATTPKIAIIGKPNVGKSSIINAFMSEGQKEKSGLLVSDLPGTTRDATDTIIKYHDKEYLFMDTAGIKRMKNTKGELERFSAFRSIQALEESDIAILILDMTEPVSKQDKRIAGMAIEEGKGLIVLANKMDLLSSEQKKIALQELKRELNFCTFAPILPCSAETREGLLKIFELIDTVQENRRRRIPTKDLLLWFQDAVYGQPMGSIASSKHLTQAEELPPTFVLFVKDPKKVHVSQLRHLDNDIRKKFELTGTPVRWVTKAR